MFKVSRTGQGIDYRSVNVKRLFTVVRSYSGEGELDRISPQKQKSRNLRERREFKFSSIIPFLSFYSISSFAELLGMTIEITIIDYLLATINHQIVRGHCSPVVEFIESDLLSPSDHFHFLQGQLGAIRLEGHRARVRLRADDPLPGRRK